MSAPISGPGSRDDRFEQVLHAYLGGQAEEAACAELQAFLAEPGYRRAFLAAAVIEGRLRSGATAVATTARPVAARARAWAAIGAATLAAALVLSVGLAPRPEAKAEEIPQRTVSIRLETPLGAYAVAAPGARSSAEGVVVQQPADRPTAIRFVALHRSPNPSR